MKVIQPLNYIKYEKSAAIEFLEKFGGSNILINTTNSGSQIFMRDIG